MAGDIQVNPGPIKFPCKICNKPVKRNQMGLQCDNCDFWLHAKCLSISREDYLSLDNEPNPWNCPPCTLSNFPFADCSHLSSISDSLLSSSSFLDDPSDPSNPSFSANLLSSIKNQKGIKIAHLNICSLYPKLDQLKIILHDKVLDILFISETWLNDTFSDMELHIPGYNFMREDRSSRRGGGLCAYVSDKYIVDKISLLPENTPDTEPHDSGLETLWLKLKLTNTKPIYLCGLYRPPDTSQNDCLRDLESQLDGFPLGSEIIILGDFNINYLVSNSAFKALHGSLVNLRNFFQFIHDITRKTVHSASIIDLAFSNKPHMISSSGVISCGLSDHSMIYITRKGRRPKGKAKIIRARTYRHFNLTDYHADLNNTDWSQVTNAQCPQVAWTIFYGIFLPICDKHAPFVNIQVRDREPPWVTDELRSLANDRDYYRAKAENSDDLQDWAKARKLRNTVNNLTTKLKKDFVSDSIQNNINDPKKLWKSLKSIIPSKISDGPSKITKENKEISDAVDMANSFNEFFASIGDTLASKIPPHVFTPPERKVNTDFKFLPITSDTLLLQFRSLPNGKSTGLDALSTRLLKDGVSTFIIPMTHIFNCSLRTGNIPSEWKTARVTPIYKDGSKDDVSNYRPISVLPVTMKVLERLVHHQFYDFLTVHNLITSNQSGFRKQHSTASALIHFTDQILQDIDAGKSCGVLFLDLKKAFDTVNHDILLQKLKIHGVDATELSWFRSYLSDRYQCTTINGSLSDPKILKCGVPQGSILGPLLFILYINDLPDAISKCNVMLYADDTALYYSHRDFAEIERILNFELLNISQWFQTNKLTLNASKTKFMLFGSPSKLKNPNYLEIKIDDEIIEQVTVFKYLGVQLDNILSFASHFDYTIRKINSKLAALGRASRYLDTKLLLTLYKALILPHLDYCDIVWDSCSKKYKSKLQILQNRALRMIFRRDRNTPTTELHRMGGLRSLQERRKFHMGIFMFRATNNTLPTYISDKFISANRVHEHATRSASTRSLHIPYARTNYGKNSISFRGAAEWNSIPNTIRTLPSLSLFKRHYQSYLTSL